MKSYNNLSSQDLNGTYYVIYTNIAGTVGCDKVTYTVDENDVISGYFETPGCCLKLSNLNTTDPTQLQQIVTPGPGCSFTSPAKYTVKLIASTGTGTAQCLIIYKCASTGGVSVFCRQPNVASQGLLDTVFELLTDLTGLVVELLFDLFLPPLEPVSQVDCSYQTDVCPT